MPRPVIAIPWPKAAYVSAVEQAGGAFREIAPAIRPLPGSLDGCAGLLLTGGSDVEPSRYGASRRHPTISETDAERDDYELRLVELALARDLPIFGICRGLQLLNVAGGGTLVQDIPSERPSGVPHAVREPRDATPHEVDVDPESALGRILAGPATDLRAVPVNSRHHQAVLAVAPSFRVTAVAPDGLVEAIERPDASFCLGVQWHPEDFPPTGRFAPIFIAFVEAARRSRS